MWIEKQKPSLPITEFQFVQEDPGLNSKMHDSVVDMDNCLAPGLLGSRVDYT